MAVHNDNYEVEILMQRCPSSITKQLMETLQHCTGPPTVLITALTLNTSRIYISYVRHYINKWEVKQTGRLRPSQPRQLTQKAGTAPNCNKIFSAENINTIKVRKDSNRKKNNKKQFRGHFLMNYESFLVLLFINEQFITFREKDIYL